MGNYFPRLVFFKNAKNASFLYINNKVRTINLSKINQSTAKSDIINQSLELRYEQPIRLLVKMSLSQSQYLFSSSSQPITKHVLKIDLHNFATDIIK